MRSSFTLGILFAISFALSSQLFANPCSSHFLLRAETQVNDPSTWIPVPVEISDLDDAMKDLIRGWALAAVTDPNQDFYLIVDENGKEFHLPIAETEIDPNGPTPKLCSMGSKDGETEEYLAIALYDLLSFYKSNGYQLRAFNPGTKTLNIIESEIGWEHLFRNALNTAQTESAFIESSNNQSAAVERVAKSYGLPLKATRSFAELKTALDKGHRAIIQLRRDKSYRRVSDKPVYAKIMSIRHLSKLPKILAVYRREWRRTPTRVARSLQLNFDRAQMESLNASQKYRFHFRERIVLDVVGTLLEANGMNILPHWKFLTMPQNLWQNPFTLEEIRTYLGARRKSEPYATEPFLVHSARDGRIFLTRYSDSDRTFSMSLLELKKLIWSAFIPS